MSKLQDKAERFAYITLAESKAERFHRFLSVFGSHEIWAGQYQIVLRHGAVLRVVSQKYDRQITLKPLLLVDCELNLLFQQRLDDHGRNVEDANFDFAY